MRGVVDVAACGDGGSGTVSGCAVRMYGGQRGREDSRASPQKKGGTKSGKVTHLS